MDEKFHEMLSFVLTEDAGLTSGLARSIASFFTDIDEFLAVKQEDFAKIKTIGGRKVIIPPTVIEKIVQLQASGLLQANQTVAENFLSAISRDFTRTQVQMIRGLNLDRVNVNPFLIQSLNLHTPEEVMHLNVYMVVTRSIVTSMGFFVERLLLASSESIEKATRPWDMVKTEPDGTKHWIQVKSGPNDMDKDQILYWAEKISEKVSEGDKAYVGITYGKRSLETVTIGLLKQLLPDWELKTLFGRELWDFVSDDPDYHNKIFSALRRAASQVLGTNSISGEIANCIDRLTTDFIAKYGEGQKGVSEYLAEIF